jgi:hypothetical protein
LRLTVPSFIRVLLVVLAATVAVVHAQPAAAKKSKPACWKTLLNDWYDGRIDNTYPAKCYSQALKHLPQDVSTYSSARDDILRALQSARAKAGKNFGPNTLIGPNKGKKRKNTVVVNTSGRKPGKGLTGVASDLNPSGPSSLPVPLLVLGGLGVLLVAAGGVGLAVKQIQARRTGH